MQRSKIQGYSWFLTVWLWLNLSVPGYRRTHFVQHAVKNWILKTNLVNTYTWLDTARYMTGQRLARKPPPLHAARLTMHFVWWILWALFWNEVLSEPFSALIVISAGVMLITFVSHRRIMHEALVSERIVTE